ncbi:MAG: 4-alpha-glucanotransferase [Acidobacteria bacterium]|nr:MAG: 4-alpha-glucanotransferase [Acidobacteriota bacterium]
MGENPHCRHTGNSWTRTVSFPRSSGILLHPTSLPGPFGIGDLGPVAYEFADFLADSGQSIWQMLPLGPTGYGDSPYQCFSAFAGNPALISLSRLADEGLLDARDIDALPEFSREQVEYERVNQFKQGKLSKAFAEFRSGAPQHRQQEFAQFVEAERDWLADYALFRALKDKVGGVAWPKWDPELVSRKPAAVQRARKELALQIGEQEFLQFVFFEQWNSLKEYCGQKRIHMMGDLPIYVAHDSADVWAQPEYFHLDSHGGPTKVAGVPPDYFSATGQLWGNPIYHWERMAADEYSWWIKRFRAAFSMFDMLRVDHFRGFEAYWEVPAGERTAQNGKWVKGPGAELFAVLEAKLECLPILAENLGVITPEVEAIRERFGFPGMAILQFAFGNDPQGPSFRPHNYPRNLVAYTGTHDNDTVIGWWTSKPGEGSIRTEEDIRKERQFTRTYLGYDDTGISEPINWVFIRSLMASVADTVVFPLQDVLGEGAQARMNVPGTATGNWRWRFRGERLTEDIASRLRKIASIYDRLS